MDKTRMAFEQWWDGRQESLDRKAGAWDAWLYLTGNDTLAHRQAAASEFAQDVPGNVAPGKPAK